jgi:hypothetical protein
MSKRYNMCQISHRNVKHRAITSWERGPQILQQTRMFKYSAEHIGKTHSQTDAYNKGEKALPAIFTLNSPADEEVERNPHNRARDSTHNPIGNSSAIEIEPQEESLIKI